MIKGIIAVICGGRFGQSEPAKQMLWSTAGYLETTPTFTSGRWRPTTFSRSPRPVSWVWRPQTGRSRVKQPNHQLTTIWTSAMMSCVRALTSRSVKHHLWTPDVVFFWDALIKTPSILLSFYHHVFCSRDTFSLWQDLLFSQLYLSIWSLNSLTSSHPAATCAQLTDVSALLCINTCISVFHELTELNKVLWSKVLHGLKQVTKYGFYTARNLERNIHLKTYI